MRGEWSSATEAEYLRNFSIHPDDFQHWVAVLGRRANGLYIIADPMSSVGIAILATAREIARFFADGLQRFNVRDAWELSGQQHGQ